MSTYYDFQTTAEAQENLGSTIDLETQQGKDLFAYLMSESRIRERDDKSVFPMVHAPLRSCSEMEFQESFDRR